MYGPHKCRLGPDLALGPPVGQPWFREFSALDVRLNFAQICIA